MVSRIKAKILWSFLWRSRGILLMSLGVSVIMGWVGFNFNEALRWGIIALGEVGLEFNKVELR